MRARVIPQIDIAALDEQLLLANGKMRLMPAAELSAFGIEVLQAWAHQRARYQLVTKELIDWLKERIGSRFALEIGAGMGDIGYHLGIHMTDSAVQAENEDVSLYVQACGQVPTDPPADVERIDAESAVAKYQPQVVIGCWITQKWHPGDAMGSVYGPEEIRIVNSAQCYVHVGNRNVHGAKRILRLKHREYRPSWLVSRAFDPSKNQIYVWGS